MECKILTEINFNITITSPLRFLNRYSRIADFSKSDYYFANYLLELSLIDYNMMKFIPSVLASAAIFLV